MNTETDISGSFEDAQMRRAEFKLKRIETGVRIVGAVVVLGTLFLAWRDYVSSRNDEIQRRTVERSRLFVEQKKERERLLVDQKKEREQRDQEFKLQL